MRVRVHAVCTRLALNAGIAHPEAIALARPARRSNQ
jgi:hypothetical protein